jgi:hypothetical protein
MLSTQSFYVGVVCNATLNAIKTHVSRPSERKTAKCNEGMTLYEPRKTRKERYRSGDSDGMRLLLMQFQLFDVLYKSLLVDLLTLSALPHVKQ